MDTAEFRSTPPARGLVVSASASVLEGLKSDSRRDLTKTLWIGAVAFVSGAQCAEDPQGTQNEPGQMIPNAVYTVVALQDHCSCKAPSKHHIKSKSFCALLQAGHTLVIHATSVYFCFI